MNQTAPSGPDTICCGPLCEDGHAQERSLVPAVLPWVEPGDRWLGDRNFCTPDILCGIVAAGACFAIRPHGQRVGQLLG